LGKFVGSKTTDKVIPITKSVIGTMAGGAADCSYFLRLLSAKIRYWETLENRTCSATRCAHVLASMLREQRGLSVGTMIMGFDQKSPLISYVDDTGVCAHGRIFAVGSGSAYAISTLDSGLPYIKTKSDAIELALLAIRRATHRDAFSGGFINVYHLSIGEGGSGEWRHIKRVDSDFFNSLSR